jgi:hypothetical protein
MKTLSQLSLLFGLLLFFSGCKENQNPSPTNPNPPIPEERGIKGSFVLISSESSNSSLKSRLSVLNYIYDKDSPASDKKFSITSQDGVFLYNEYINAPLFLNDTLYLARGKSHKLDIISKNSLSNFKTITYSPYVGVYDNLRFSAIYKSRFITCETLYNYGGIYLNIIDLNTSKRDSIHLGNELGYISDVIMKENNLFIAAKTTSGTTISVFDADKGFKKIAEWPTVYICEKFYLDENDDIIAFIRGNSQKINKTTFAQTPLDFTQVPMPLFRAIQTYVESPAFDIDKKNNILYHLSPTTQPSMYLYFLAKYDFKSKTFSKFLNSYENMDIKVSSFNYDEKTDLIFLGGSHNTRGNIIKIFDTNGVFIKELSVDGLPNKIFFYK